MPGTSGRDGLPGIEGRKGERGYIGQKGDQGLSGPIGFQGEKGDQGITSILSPKDFFLTLKSLRLPWTKWIERNTWSQR